MVTDAARKTTGREGEQAAADYLTAQGWRVVARNWHCRGGELDLVATKDGLIAFVEVKTRRANAMVSPLQSVNYRKQQRVVLAASLYLTTHHIQNLQPRFDVAAVTACDGGYTVDYYPAAYLAGDRY